MFQTFCFSKILITILQIFAKEQKNQRFVSKSKQIMIVEYFACITLVITSTSVIIRQTILDMCCFCCVALLNAYADKGLFTCNMF